MLRVIDSLEQFCRVYSESGEQHRDFRDSQSKRDSSDVQLVTAYFEENPPFRKSEKCISISSGIVGSEKTNCFDAFSVGCKILSQVSGKKFGDVKLSRQNRVRNLEMDSLGTFKVQNHDVTFDPLRLFQRISLSMTSQEDIRDYLNYELSPYPPSLFDQYGMRKTNKAALYAIFDPKEEKAAPENSTFIIDGGWLLHRCVWPEGATFCEILENYIAFVLRNFKAHSVNSYVIRLPIYFFSIFYFLHHFLSKLWREGEKGGWGPSLLYFQRNYTLLQLWGLSKISKNKT